MRRHRAIVARVLSRDPMPGGLFYHSYRLSFQLVDIMPVIILYVGGSRSEGDIAVVFDHELNIDCAFGAPVLRIQGIFEMAWQRVVQVSLSAHIMRGLIHVIGEGRVLCYDLFEVLDVFHDVFHLLVLERK